MAVPMRTAMSVPRPPSRKMLRVPDDDAAEDVAAELVGAERMAQRGRRQPQLGVLRLVVVGRHPRAEDGEEEEEAEDDGADQRRRTPAQAAPVEPPRLGPRRGRRPGPSSSLAIVSSMMAVSNDSSVRFGSTKAPSSVCVSGAEGEGAAQAAPSPVRRRPPSGLTAAIVACCVTRVKCASRNSVCAQSGARNTPSTFALWPATAVLTRKFIIGTWSCRIACACL